MHPAFARTDHRPWPLPDRPWAWRQSWRDLLFAHWPVPVAAVRGLVPSSLNIDVFDGMTWVGIVPFRMVGVSRRPLPDLPGLSAFPELNLRLYVVRDARPGVWFLSLDAGNRLAVWAARRWFHLPYFRAQMSCLERAGRIFYRSQRCETSSPVRFAAEYAPVSEPFESQPGTLEHWLTERYCLYAQSPDGALWRGEVHHVPWPLQKAEATIEKNELAEPYGVPLEGPPLLLHFARRLDVVVWPLERVAEPVQRPELVPAALQAALKPA
jgi:uncharacterized protein YqjF (DUF2071 family)